MTKNTITALQKISKYFKHFGCEWYKEIDNAILVLKRQTPKKVITGFIASDYKKSLRFSKDAGDRPRIVLPIIYMQKPYDKYGHCDMREIRMIIEDIK